MKIVRREDVVACVDSCRVGAAKVFCYECGKDKAGAVPLTGSNHDLGDVVCADCGRGFLNGREGD